MIAERDADLGDHVSGVVEFSAAVSKMLGLSPDRVEHVRRASALHDIGKLAIPESILEKPSPLSAEEWQFVRQHTIIGERILAAAPSLASCAKIVRSTHEWWDGTGYPDGLAGQDIPLEARIIAVCDAFQAMTTHRPYRQARTIENAIVELRSCAGTQFDPHVVRAFVASLATLTQHAGDKIM